jgi:hypothetical protein
MRLKTMEKYTILKLNLLEKETYHWALMQQAMANASEPD